MDIEVSNVVITNCTFLKNKSIYGGGAIHGMRSNKITIEASNFENNTVLEKGGGTLGF